MATLYLMNIVFLSHRVPFPPNKGEKIRTFHQINRLKDLGHKIHLFAPTEHSDESAFFEELHRTYCASVHTHPMQAKAIRLLTGLVKNQPMSVANFYNNKLQSLFDHFLTREKVDAIICTASSMAEYIFNSTALSHMANKPILIMDFMDVDSDKWAQYTQNSGFPKRWIYAREQRLLARYEQKIATDFDACYLIAQAEVDLFNRKIVKSDKVHVLGNGLDTTTFYPPKTKPTSTAPVFLFTGVMDYKPNADAVIWFVENCWSELRQEHPQARFIVAGMTPNADVQKLSEQPGIEVTGFVSDILPYYHQATIFVAPFRLARGVQNKVLQAFSCALPVVSTPMGAEGILCQADRDILLANQPGEFIAQIRRLVDSPELSGNISQNALTLIQTCYSWEGQLQPLEKLLLQAGNKT